MLDNCEHLLEACAGLAETLLKNCPGLKILATSREVLAVMGEASYRVPSLGLPPLENYQEPLHEFELACLFEARARLVQADFSLSMQNSAAIAQICNRLDGIPLSIELAAGHVNMLSPAEIAAQLDHSFSVLTGGSRTALPRQQTMRASIDWSWDLLTELERILLRRLSIFAGGWTLESAQAICSDNLVKRDRIVGLISQLINKSLLTVNPGSAGGTRYTFHEVVRQYMAEKLVEAGEVEQVQAARLGYFLAFSEQVGLGMAGPQQLDWFRRALEERDNLRAAMLYAAQTDQVEPGLYISGRLVAFWDGFDIREGERWLAGFIQKPESKDHPHARATALLAQSELLMWLQQFPQALAAARECLALYRACADRPGEADALVALGYCLEFLSERPSALEYYQQSLALARSLGDVHRQALALFHLGDASTVKVLDFWEEAIPLFRLAGDWEMLSGLFYQYGKLCPVIHRRHRTEPKNMWTRQISWTW